MSSSSDSHARGTTEPSLPDQPLLWQEALAGGAHWSRVLRRGTTLRITALAGGANVAALLYRAEDPLERYCMPDTLKAQHVSRLTAGVALYSDMGRVLASIVSDSCGWHDTISGHTSRRCWPRAGGPSATSRRATTRRASARELLLVELAKHGLGRADLVANVNFFTKVAIDQGGELAYEPDHSAAGSSVTLRFELDTLLVLACHAPPARPPRWNGRRGRSASRSGPRQPRRTIPCAARAPRTNGACRQRGRAAMSSERDPALASLECELGAGERWLGAAMRAERCGSSTCTATRPSTRCSSTPTTTPTATAPSTPSASRAAPTSASARACRSTRGAAREHRRRHLRAPRHARRRLLAKSQLVRYG